MAAAKRLRLSFRRWSSASHKAEMVRLAGLTLHCLIPIVRD
jgi:hypothetical protein